MYRAGAANNIAVEVLQNLPDGEKFVAIYGKAHLQSQVSRTASIFLRLKSVTRTSSQLNKTM